MRIVLTSIFVDDQEKALKFYTEILGFFKKSDLPAGKYRWLTVVSPEDPEGTQLVLEPNDNDAARQFQAELMRQFIPLTAFAVEDVPQEYERLRALGVVFTLPPTETGGSNLAIFNDTCGNLIQIFQG